MSKIIQHSYAKEDSTPIFQSMDTEQVIAYVPKGSWMGIVERCGSWMKVISARFDGWVQMKALSVNPEFSSQLQVQYRNESLQYFIPVQALKAG